MNGIVNIYKPLGITSFGVISRVRQILGIKKAGHTGTLDPMAEGVLPVCIGKGTKAAGILTDTDKRYRAEMKLGITTDTQDMQGTVLSRCEHNVTENEFRAVMNRFTGEIQQLPPMYSAVKIGGKKLYELARKGIEVERRPRNVNVYSINLLEFSHDKIILDIECSKGTYIRTICSDIGDKLGCGGTMLSLTRTRAGIFTSENSVSLESFAENPEKYIIPVDCVFDYPKYMVCGKTEEMVKNGCTVRADVCAGQMYRVYGENGEFLCLSRGINPENPCLKLHTFFFG